MQRFPKKCKLPRSNIHSVGKMFDLACLFQHTFLMPVLCVRWWTAVLLCSLTFFYVDDHEKTEQSAPRFNSPTHGMPMTSHSGVSVSCWVSDSVRENTLNAVLAVIWVTDHTTYGLVFYGVYRTHNMRWSGVCHKKQHCTH